VFNASKTFKGKQQKLSLHIHEENQPMVCASDKIPELRKQAEMHRVFDNLDSALKEMPHESLD
jgi:hypothetical protein